MGKSCTKLAAEALARAERQLCIGKTSNVYRLDDGSEAGLQLIIESWEEDTDGGIRFELLKCNQDGTASDFAIVSIDKDGKVWSGPLHWYKAVEGQPLGVPILQPIED